MEKIKIKGFDMGMILYVSVFLSVIPYAAGISSAQSVPCDPNDAICNQFVQDRTTNPLLHSQDNPTQYNGNPGEQQGISTITQNSDGTLRATGTTASAQQQSARSSGSGFQYRLLEGIPGFYDRGQTIGLPQLVTAIYKFGIWTVGIAALFMIVIGGFMYMTSAGNTSKSGNAKTFIFDALMGLIAALTAYLLLYIINPDLVGTANPTLFQNQTVDVGSQMPGYTPPPMTDGNIQELASQILANGNIRLDTSGDCKAADGSVISPRRNIEELSQGKQMTVCNGSCRSGTPCTRVATPPKEMLQGMLQVASQGSYRISSIAGGQHCEVGRPGCSGTSGHYLGVGIDVIPQNSSRSGWDSNVGQWENTAKASAPDTFCDVGGRPVSCSGGTQDHIHVSFKNYL